MTNNNKKTWFDKLKAPIRHALICFAGTFFGSAITQILTVGNIFLVNYWPVFLVSLNAATLATLGVISALYLSKINSQYGRTKTQPEQSAEVAEEPTTD